MVETFQKTRLDGRSFRGEDWSGADFSSADIRGADFTGAILVGANFACARCGLRRSWAVALIIGSMVLTFVTGVVFGFASAVTAFLTTPPPTAFSAVEERIFSAVALALVAGWMVIALRRGFGAALMLFALLTALVTLAAVVAPVEITAAGLILLMAIGAPITSLVGLAVALALIQRIAGPRAQPALLALALVSAMFSMWEGVQGFSAVEGPLPPEALLLSLLVAAPVTIIFLAVGVYVSGKAMLEDERFGLVRTVVIGLLALRGTSFRGANLTEASFEHSVLAYADLRDTLLTCTNWLAATQLESARTERTYLANTPLRDLAITKDGREQNYDRMNLEGFHLVGANLAGASLIGANLSKATLRQADLSGAKLVQTQLYDTDLRNARLTGAYIEEWAISTDTKFDGVDCEYVFMRLPTAQNPDPWRKPDNRMETFQPGEFTNMMTPLLSMLELYRHQHIDLSAMGQAFRTLDLFHRNEIDPAASTLALQRLAQRHPEAGLEVVALAGQGKEALRLHAVVAENVDSARLSADYSAIYGRIRALPRPELERQFINLVQSDGHIHQLENLLEVARGSNSTFLQTRIRFKISVKCLVVAANPDDLEKLRLDVEIREITEALRLSPYGHLFEVFPVLAARTRDLMFALNKYMPQVVHFSAHGASTGEIILVDDDNRAKPVSADALRALFSAMKDNVRLVILNACYGETQASVITEVIDFAIGMSGAISDRAATQYTTAFYSALGFGRSIQASHEQGVAALKLEGVTEADQPTVLWRNGVDPASIFLVAADPTPGLPFSEHKTASHGQ